MILVPTIICGGKGSRLWPASQAHRPKPFMKIGEGGSLLQQTFRRAAALPDVTEILTVTGQELHLATQHEFRQVNDRGLKTPFILEPFGRNTAAAVATAALHCAEAHGEDAVMLILPADHLVENQQAFVEAVMAGRLAARQGLLVAFGIDPISAHTGYGYIEADKSSASTGSSNGWHSVRRFVEKPGPEKAEEFLQSGDYFWNSGMYCFRPGVLLQEMRQHCPAIFETASECFRTSIAAATSGAKFLALDYQSFSAVPNLSIDVALMEKTRNIAVVHGQFVWSDIGSWSAIAALTRKDQDGNSGSGNSFFYNSANCYVYGSERNIGIVGLEDIVIVDSPDGLLVAHRDQAQDVKHIYAKSESAPQLTNGLGKTKHKPWGKSKIIESADGILVKRLAIDPGSRISRHDPGWPAGPWFVAAGLARVIGQNGQVTERAGGEAYHCNSRDQEILNAGEGVLTLLAIDQNAGNGLAS